MIRTIIMSLCILIHAFNIKAITPQSYNTYQSIETEIKNTFKQRLGKRYTTLSPQELRDLYQDAQQSVYQHCNNFITQECIHKVVDQQLTTKAGNYMYTLASTYTYNNKISPTRARELYEQHVKKQCSEYPTTPIFETYFNDTVIQSSLEKYAQQDQNHSGQSSSTAPSNLSTVDRLVSFIDRLFSSSNPSVPSTPTEPNPHYTHNENQNYNQQSAHPVPSAPSYSNANTLFPQASCSMCLNEFANDHLESFFLPCGHNFCRDCTGGWFFTQKKATCPLCNYTLNPLEKNDLKNSLSITNICCLCNKKDGSLHRLNYCAHMIHGTCHNKWVNQQNEYAQTCPRCSAHI